MSDLHALDSLFQKIKQRDPNQAPFHQAVEEVFISLAPFLAKNPQYTKYGILERLVEPERVITFRVTWVDDNGNVQVNRGYRIQMNSAIGPYKGGIAFNFSGMHAVEDYVVSRYQMYMQVYFHPVSRGMEVVLNHLLKRATECYHSTTHPLKYTASFLKPFFEKNWTLEDYLRLDDSVLNTYFAHWQIEDDAILSDLADRFINRRPFKSVPFNHVNDVATIERMKELVQNVGYNTEYYTAINNSYDLPYDFYRPDSVKPRTQIELMERNGNMVELSLVSSIVSAISGRVRGDERLYFPREMFAEGTSELFSEDYQEFQALASKLDVYSNQMK